MHWEVRSASGESASGGGGLHPGGGGLHLGRGICILEVCIQGEGSASEAVCIQGAGQIAPKIHGILWDTVNEQAVHILLECILVIT